MLYNLSPEYLYIWIPVFFYALFPKEKKWLTWYIVIMMVFLAMMRGLEVGTDHLGYEDDFYSLHSLQNMENQMRHRFEWGFVACILLFKQFSNDYLTFSALCFLPFFIGSMWLIKQRSRSMALSLLVFWSFFYLTSYNVIRQFLCMAMIAPCVCLFDKKGGYLKFATITIILSFLFHHSSLMMLALIPIHWYCSRIEKSDKKVLSLLVIGSFVVFYIGNTFFKSFFVTLSAVMNLSEFEGYITQAREEAGGNTYSLFYTLYMLIVIYVIDARKYKFELYVVVVSICLFNIFNTMSIFASRVYWDFWLYSVVLIPNIMVDKNTRHRKLFYLVTIVFCTAYFFFTSVLGNSGEINPYYFRTF